MTSFVGRESALHDLKRRAADSRLLTLTGPAGVGKTRLAAELAERLEAEGSPPVYWVNLSPLADPNLLPQAVASALGIREQPGQPLMQTLVDVLSARACLLLLDSCEHLLPACTNLVKALLHRSVKVRIVATSRQPFGLIGETRYPVPPLSLDAPAREAMALFLERAASVLPAFRLTAKNEAAIGEICQRLDGLPLAIELAAARVNVLSVEQIADRLDDRFGLLQAGSLTSNWQTLTEALDWSYELLTPQAQMLLRRVAVFHGSFTLEAAEAVCADDLLPASLIFEQMARLADQSLLMADTTADGDACYRLLETIQAYALQKLAAGRPQSYEEVRLRVKHLAYFTNIVEKIAPRLYGANQQVWFAQLDRDLPNLRGALRWALADGQISTGMRLAVALGQYWIQRRYLEEGQRWLEALADLATEDTPLDLRTRASIYAAFCASLRLDAAGTQHLAEQSVALAEESGDPALRMMAYGSYAGYFGAIGDNERAYRFVKSALELAHRLGDAFTVGMASFNLAIHAMGLGKFEEAQVLLDESVANASAANDPFRIGQSFKVLGDLKRMQGAWKEGRSAYAHAIDTFERGGAANDAAAVRHDLALVCVQEGELARAHALLAEAVRQHWEQGNRHGVTETLLGYGALAAALNEPETAATLLTALRALINQPVVSFYPASQQTYRIVSDAVQGALSDSALARAVTRGRQLSLRDALALAQSLAPPGEARPAPLTPRQLDVVELIAEGKTNGEIAEALVLSKRTVEKHIANVLSRLNLSNRAEIVRWALERDAGVRSNTGGRAV